MLPFNRMLPLALAAAGLCSCFAAQPAPECNVVTASDGVGVSPYFVTLSELRSKGDCSQAPSNHLVSTQVAMQRFIDPRSTQSFTINVRTSYSAGVVGGDVYECDDDLSNDCTHPSAPGACAFCVVGSGANAHLRDGGVAIDPMPSADGGLQGVIIGDGGTRLSLSNACQVTVETVARTDSSDPDARELDNVTRTARTPTDGVCELTPLSGGSQHLDAYTCADGTELPAITLSTTWKQLEVINSAKAPSTYFTAQLAITEGTCVTEYEALGFWPPVDCATTDESGHDRPDDSKCDPNADLDAGRVLGSGISPNFKPRCDADLLVCVPTAHAAQLK